MRLKVVQDEITDECHVHLDSKHFDENGDHEDEIEDWSMNWSLFP